MADVLKQMDEPQHDQFLGGGPGHKECLGSPCGKWDKQLKVSYVLGSLNMCTSQHQMCGMQCYNLDGAEY